MSILKPRFDYSFITSPEVEVKIDGVSIKIHTIVNETLVSVTLDPVTFKVILDPQNEEKSLSDLDAGITLALMPHSDLVEKVTYYVLNNIKHRENSHIFRSLKKQYFETLVSHRKQG